MSFSGWPMFPKRTRRHEYHDVLTVTLGELIEGGFIDWTTPEWQWNAVSDAQRERVNKMIECRFWYREIGAVPPGIWRRDFMRIINEAMSSLAPFYRQLEGGEFDILQTGNDYGKSREIYSEFPQTMLAGNEDYASTGNDRAYEDVHEGSILDALAQADTVRSLDVILLDRLETCFSCLFTVDIDAY